MYQFIFTNEAKHKYEKLDISIQNRIKTKLQTLKTYKHIFAILKPLIDFAPATHRIRIGNYRLILAQKSDTDFLIIDVGHRSKIYK